MAAPTQTRERSETSSDRGGNHGTELQPFDDLYKYFEKYAREKPEVVAMCCFGVGFILGWKLKPW